MSNDFLASEYKKGKYLKGVEVDKRKPIQLTIGGVSQEEFPEQGKKLVLSFLEIDQLMILNKTQVGSLIDFFGERTGVWCGQRIRLMQVPSSYQGKPTILITEGETVAPNVRAADSAEVLFEGQ
jgi:hypothetical protein